MNVVQIEKHIEIRAKAMAEAMAEEKFETWKAEYLAKFHLDGTFIPVADRKRVRGKKQITYTLADVLSLKSDSKLRQVYDILENSGGRLDRHQVYNSMQMINKKEISMGTVNGRLGDLIKSGIIEEVGFHEGKFGKSIALYSISK